MEEARRERIRQLEEKGRKANRLKAPDSPQPLRVDPATGLPIYSAESLRISTKGGETKDCPFDCNCCF